MLHTSLIGDIYRFDDRQQHIHIDIQTVIAAAYDTRNKKRLKYVDRTVLVENKLSRWLSALDNENKSESFTECHGSRE